MGENHSDSRQLARLKSACEQDLQRYGLIPEIVGRLPVSVHLDDLDKETLVRILQEPKNALVKQYEKMFELEGIGLTFDPDAIQAIAEKTLDRNTGARGLRSIIEDIMRDVMFDIPSRDDVSKFIPTYLNRKLVDDDPFVTLDQRAVGRLMKMAIEESRGRKKGIKYGICGEHGGDPRSIQFCHEIEEGLPSLVIR